MMRVLVAGGGIAGIAAAVRLAEHGARVTILETRRKLGGRATSFEDQRTGLTLDNCQHVALGCCTSYLDLLGRLGAADRLVWHREQYWVEEGGRVSVIRPGWMPAPLHFAGSVVRAGFLRRAEVAALGRAMLAIARARRAGHEAETFGAFLARLRQPEGLVRRFWSPVVVSACNLAVERVSAAAALQVFQEGFLGSARAAEMGVPAVPLARLYDGLTAALPGTAREGGSIEVVLGAGVERLGVRQARTTDGREFAADRVICALPVERVAGVVEESARQDDPRFGPLERFGHSPILGVHLVFERPVIDVPHAVLVDRPTQWLFRKHDEPRALHAVISAADGWMDLTEERIVERVLADLHACFPGSANVPRIAARAVKEKRATFALTPGIEALRPGALGPRGGDGLILAGDYTATGWPATMEGAARSGYAAAAAALGRPASEFLAPPLSPKWLARLLLADQGDKPGVGAATL